MLCPMYTSSAATCSAVVGARRNCASSSEGVVAGLELGAKVPYVSVWEDAFLLFEGAEAGGFC